VTKLILPSFLSALSFVGLSYPPSALGTQVTQPEEAALLLSILLSCLSQSALFNGFYLVILLRTEKAQASLET
jgi:hypothetical protein